jgi:hypothetical protein
VCGSNLCYVAIMWREKLRRISAVVLALTLALGLVVHGIGNSDLGMKSAMAAAASDMPMSGDCNGCGDDHSSMPTACAAFCGSVAVLPVTAVIVDVVAIDTLYPPAAEDATGHVGPPDPYPPRPVSMS